MELSLNLRHDSEEEQRKINRAIAILNEVLKSELTPSNIKKVLADVLRVLLDAKLPMATRTIRSVPVLEELGGDPNMPSSAKVPIWEALSVLESVRDTA
jgi:uncharacterized protein (UPF0147 family)